MIALDYFLYDNRTWSPRWGRDWGLKEATGALADRADLKAQFDRYCGAMPGDQGQLRGFGEALGGMASRDGGYLLCVTLESSDSFGRPSWAVYGLWCPGTPTLQQVLSQGDPIGSVRAVLGADTPPTAIELRAANPAIVPTKRRGNSPDPEFLRFKGKATVGQVLSLLLGAVKSKSKLPSVLGVTATSRLRAVAQAGFNRVYCLPLDDRAERALAQVQSPRELDEPLPVSEEAILAPAATLPPPKPATGSAGAWAWGLAIAIIAMAILLLMAREIWRAVPAWEGESPLTAPETHSELNDPPLPKDVDSQDRSPEAALEEIKERLEEFKALDPEALRESPGFVAAETLEVLPEHQERRERVRQAYEALLEIRGRMVKRPQDNYVAYYFDEDGKDQASMAKLEKIAKILGEAPLGSDDCRVIKEAFGFEFETGGSVVRQWCDALGRLEKTAGRNLSIPSRNPKHEGESGSVGGVETPRRAKESTDSLRTFPSQRPEETLRVDLKAAHGMAADASGVSLYPEA